MTMILEEDLETNLRQPGQYMPETAVTWESNKLRHVLVGK